jgi:hypothetical protein
VVAAQQRRHFITPWVRWAFGLAWAVIVELRNFQSAEDPKAAAHLLPKRALLRCLHDGAFMRLLSKLLRAAAACRVRLSQRLALLAGTGPHV